MFFDPFSLIVSLVFFAAQTLIQLATRQDQQARQAGFKGTAQVGGDHPLAFIMGFYATAGKLEYAGSWGTAGETPNAYLTKIYTLSDLPVRGLRGVLVNGVRCTLGDTPHATRGYPVLEYRVNGTDHLWVRFADGTQTAADTLLLSAFGADPERPWLSDMVGIGVALGIWTARYNREVFNREPELIWEIDGIPLDDPRGEDGHENVGVAIDNVLRGFAYDGTWFWGPQGIGDHHLPAAVWHPQMDRCDELVTLSDASTEPRYRFGLEVSVDQEPQAVIGELLKAASGRIAEVGGIYKVLFGEPGAPVISFTDEDIDIGEPQNFDPFPGLESTFNGVTATYPEPTEAWENRDAPPRYNSITEALDDGRRLPFSTTFPAVPFANQVQRLMRAMDEEQRRFRRHTQTMPPEWWEYEVLDAVEWTSARNGYDAKVFLITLMEDQPKGNQYVGLQEQDPADYGWSSSYELPWDAAPLVISRPAPQPITGFGVAPYIGVDADGNDRRAGFALSGYAAGMADVRAVAVQARLAGTTGLILDGEAPYDPAQLSPSAAFAGDPLLPVTGYEVRGRLVPFSGRATLWSNQSLVEGEIVEGDWLAVTTPNVRLTDRDVNADLVVLGSEVIQQQAQIRQLVASFKQLGTMLQQVDRENFTERKSLFREITVQLGELEASFTEIAEVALNPAGTSAMALFVQALSAAMGGNSAEINVKWESVAAPSGYSARYAITAAVDDGSFRTATFFLDVPADPDEPTRIGFAAGQTVFFTSGGDPIALMDEDGHFRSANGAVDIDMISGDVSFTAVP